jgi:hypothetical protein
MLRNNLKKISHKNVLAFFVTLLFLSCEKEVSFENGGNNINISPDDLTTKISSSVSGFVTDENNAPVMGASVQFGSSTFTTDKYGYFEAKNVQVVKNAAFVTVAKTGYFKGIKTYTAAEGRSAFFRIKLIPKVNIGNLTASSGGTVSLPNGLSITLPAGAVVNAATNASYSGTVNIAAFWMNPETDDLSSIMPGDLRGINAEGSIKLLQTFGMAAVELTGAGGELLQIANGKTATLKLAIPASLGSTAPATIPLWYFDETNGLWKEQGSATKTGNSYVGEVSHFSFWNCDSPYPGAVRFNCTILNSSGNPVPDASINILFANGYQTWCYGSSDSSGYASGLIPANKQLIIQVIDYSCPGSVLYSKPFTTTSSNISLGNIIIPAGFTATISGSLLNCNNQPVTNGYLLLLSGYYYKRYNINNNSGNFNFSTLLCSNNVSFVAGDKITLQESPVTNYTINPGSNTVNLTACGVNSSVFFNYSIDGVSYSFTPFVDSIRSSYISPPIYWITATDNSINQTWGSIEFQADVPSIGTKPLYRFSWERNNLSDIFPMLTPNPLYNVTLTEFGQVGEYVAGSFSGTLTSSQTLLPHNITCSFRARRY